MWDEMYCIQKLAISLQGEPKALQDEMKKNGAIIRKLSIEHLLIYFIVQNNYFLSICCLPYLFCIFNQPKNIITALFGTFD